MKAMNIAKIFLVSALALGAVGCSQETPTGISATEMLEIERQKADAAHRAERALNVLAEDAEKNQCAGNIESIKDSKIATIVAGMALNLKAGYRNHAYPGGTGHLSDEEYLYPASEAGAIFESLHEKNILLTTSVADWYTGVAAIFHTQKDQPKTLVLYGEAHHSAEGGIYPSSGFRTALGREQIKKFIGDILQRDVSNASTYDQVGDVNPLSPGSYVLYAVDPEVRGTEYKVAYYEPGALIQDTLFRGRPLGGQTQSFPNPCNKGPA